MRLILSAGSAMLICAALAGCGSPDAKREKVVRCTGFSTALLNQSDDDTVKAAGQIVMSKYGITEQDTVPMGAASRTYAAAMDPARVSTITDKGKADALDLVGKKDAQGIADYTKSCVDTYKSLGKS